MEDGSGAMTHDRDDATISASVTPLRKRQADRCLYARPSEIEAQVAELSQMPLPNLIDRVCIEDPTDGLYVYSECILYFVRRLDVGNDEGALRALFTVLRQRVLRAVRVSERRIAGSRQVAENSADLEIRDIVLQKFQELLCTDRQGYDERLDFYECRFNAALALLRNTARRKVRRDEGGRESLESESEPNELSAEVEASLAALKPSHEGAGADFLYRSKLLVAISALPPDEQQVVELLLQEYPIDSQDPEVTTIVTIIGCTEKTVRNRRDRAFAKLREALKEEEA